MSQSDTTADRELPGGLDAVLVSSTNGSNRKMHRRNPLDPTTTACTRTVRRDTAEWIEKTHWRQVIHRGRCAECEWPDEPRTGVWSCPDCNRTFKTLVGLKDHGREGDCPAGGDD